MLKFNHLCNITLFHMLLYISLRLYLAFLINSTHPRNYLLERGTNLVGIEPEVR